MHDDARLAPWIAASEVWCDATGIAQVLRYVPGRRISARIEHPDDGSNVVKVFGSPRGRGNHRRLLALRGSAAAPHVPVTHATDASGHLHRLAWVPGTELAAVPSESLSSACRRLGEVTAALHASEVALDRTWTVDDELAQLARRATPRTAPLAELAAHRVELLREEPVVSAHRDLHPRQAVVDEHGGLCLIDLDEAAMAPPALDVGNLLAHLYADAVTGRLAWPVAKAAHDAFLAGYGAVPGDVLAWRWMALVRLAGLADSRHGRPDWASALARAARIVA